MRIASILLATALCVSASTTLRPASEPAPSAGAAPAAAVTPANDPAYTYKTLRLNRAAFDALNARPEQLLVIDLRRPDELTKIGGFPVYFSLQPSDVQRSLSFIPRDRLIVTVSNRAHRAGAVGDILAGLGFHVVGAIGVLDYQDEGGVLTKIAAASHRGSPRMRKARSRPRLRRPRLPRPSPDPLFS